MIGCGLQGSSKVRNALRSHCTGLHGCCLVFHLQGHRGVDLDSALELDEGGSGHSELLEAVSKFLLFHGH